MFSQLEMPRVLSRLTCDGAERVCSSSPRPPGQGNLVADSTGRRPRHKERDIVIGWRSICRPSAGCCGAIQRKRDAQSLIDVLAEGIKPGEITGISTRIGPRVNSRHRPSRMMFPFQSRLRPSARGLQDPKGAGIRTMRLPDGAEILRFSRTFDHAYVDQPRGPASSWAGMPEQVGGAE